MRRLDLCPKQCPIALRCKQNTCASVLIGLTLGIALSLVVTPLIDEDCVGSAHSHVSGIRSLQSEFGAGVDAVGESDDYEPRLKLEGKPKTARQKDTKPLVRPRFYSTELNIKEKLFVGVLSDKRTIGTLGLAMNATLAHHVDKLVFFVTAAGPKKLPVSLPCVVEFPDGPELLEPFHAIGYIGQHYVDDYDFFFLTRDTAYVRGVKLNDLVHKVSVTESVYMGKFVEDSKDNSLYCDLNGGILFSRPVLKAVVQNINWCTRNAFSDDASDNIGRCVLHSADIPCSRAVQGNIFSTFKLDESFHLEQDAGIGPSNQQSEFDAALTVYPNMNPESVYKLHIYFTDLELTETHQEIEMLQQNIVDTNEFMPTSLQSLSWPVGAAPPVKPRERFSVLRWDYLTDTHIYPDDDFSGIRNLTSLEKQDLNEIVTASVAHLRKKYDLLRYLSLENGYRRFDPTRGMEYILDLLFEDETTGTKLLKRMEALRALGKVELVPMPYVTENTRLVVLLPVAVDDRAGAMLFLKNFAQTCLEKQDNTILVFLFLQGQTAGDSQTDPYGALKNLINTYNNKYQTEGAKISYVGIKSHDGTLPLTFGIIDLISKKFPPDTLFVVCQPGMEIRTEYLNRVRMNTIAGWQVFFPIPFAQYHPDIIYKAKTYPNAIEINKNYGHFDAHIFDYFSFYISDYLAGRKLTNKKIPIARSERDMKKVEHHSKNGHDVYQMFLEMKSVHVMRAIEPSLRLRFETKTCERTLAGETYRHCLDSSVDRLGSRSQLGSLLFQYEKTQKKSFS